MSRIPLVAGNWKMHTTTADAAALAAAVARGPLPPGVEVAVCPPFTALAAVARVLEGSPVRLGAQDVFWEPRGPYTGEISPPMLVDLGCRYVIVGHSERRQHFGETDEMVRRKAAAALAHGLVPIVCVGERLDERDAGRTDAVVRRQVERAAAGLPGEQVRLLTIAYEPVWAIGTGRTPTGEEAERVAGVIREGVGSAGEDVRVLYGGSVTPANVAEFSGRPGLDGALVGGASLDASSFLSIARAFSR
jgi:triosephosphate isomerase